MAWLSDADHDRISAAVAAAEASSAGEIVTVLADRSDGYSDIQLAWSVLIGTLALAVYAGFSGFYLGWIEQLTGSWNHEWTPREVISLALTGFVLKFFGTWLLQLWQPLKFFLIPGPVKQARVRQAAVRHFKVGAERRTHGRTGILIYLSMREKRAEIVADEAIASKVSPEVWGAAMAAMLADIRQGRIADGMIAGVSEVGKVLAEHFPRAEDDQNELPDRLIEV
jgi:putative membrane protein